MNKNIIYFLFMLFNFSCLNKDKLEVGIYILDDYINKKNIDSDYIEYYLLKVSKDSITNYGTVIWWGNASVRQNSTEKIKILNDSTIKIISLNKTKYNAKYIKIKNYNNLINNKGVDFEKITNLLNEKLISGKYHHNGKLVTFFKNGRIENFYNFKNYSIKPQFYPSNKFSFRTIKIDNTYWKFEMKNKQLILTKFLDEEFEDSKILSDEKLILDIIN